MRYIFSFHVTWHEFNSWPTAVARLTNFSNKYCHFRRNFAHVYISQVEIMYTPKIATKLFVACISIMVITVLQRPSSNCYCFSVNRWNYPRSVCDSWIMNKLLGLVVIWEITWLLDFVKISYSLSFSGAWLHRFFCSSVTAHNCAAFWNCGIIAFHDQDTPINEVLSKSMNSTRPMGARI